MRTNTFHLNTFFNSISTFQYLSLRTVRHEIEQRLAAKDKISKFNTSHLLCNNLNHDIYSNNCKKKQYFRKYTIFLISTLSGYFHGGG